MTWTKAVSILTWSLSISNTLAIWMQAAKCKIPLGQLGIGRCVLMRWMKLSSTWKKLVFAGLRFNRFDSKGTQILTTWTKPAYLQGPCWNMKSSSMQLRKDKQLQIKYGSVRSRKKQRSRAGWSKLQPKITSSKRPTGWRMKLASNDSQNFTSPTAETKTVQVKAGK